MAVLLYFACFALFVQVITCQGVGNLNAGFNNGLPVGPNFANGLAGPSLGGPNSGGSGFGGPGLVGNGLIGPGLGGSGFIGSSLGGPGLAGCGLGAPGKGAGRASGGGFAVTSSSPLAPTGVSILAENLSIEGPLSVGGQLPFLGTVGLEGTLPVAGSGTVSYGCGNGNVGISSDIGSPYGLSGQYNPGMNGQYGGLAGQGFGANLAGYNPGAFGTALAAPGLVGPGLPAGPGLIGNGLNGGLGINLAGSGLGFATGATFE